MLDRFPSPHSPTTLGRCLSGACLTLALTVHTLAAPAPSSANPPRAVKLVASPLIPKTTAAGKTVLVLSFQSGPLTNLQVRLSSPGWTEPVSQPVPALARGNHALQIEVPSLKEATQITVTFDGAGLSQPVGPLTVSPARRWTVYLAQHTHTDIGYTRPQTEILPEHVRYIDYALDYCDLTDSYPDDARFRWTCETSWAVNEFARSRPARQLERLKQRLKEGRVEVCALMLNMAEIANESSIAALLRPVPALQQLLGTELRTAMQNDVNGAAWCLPDYFQDTSIRYLTMGINKTRSILPFNRPTPFWWESKSGKRILAVRADHYHLGNFWHIHQGDPEKFRPGLEDYLVSLQNRAYPFDRIGVQFSGYHTDNSPPSTAACDLVKKWNDTYAWPHLRLSTAREFLSYVESEHGAQLPVHRQAWPDWWTDGFGSAARETAAARQTESALQTSQALLAMASMLGQTISPATISRCAAVQDDLLFYQEHTFGAAESINDPLAENSQVQWGEKGSYAWSAVKSSTMLREEAFGLVQSFVPRASVPSVAIFNTLNWSRSGLVRVFIDHEILPPGLEPRIRDGNNPVRAQALDQRAEGTWWALWVEDVPPLGFKLLEIAPTTEARAKPPVSAPGLQLENPWYRVVLDAAKGRVQSIFDKDLDRELVDSSTEWGLGQCIYETMPANRQMKTNVFRRSTLRNVKAQAPVSGPIYKKISLEAAMDGCATNRGVILEVRLYETAKRIELFYALRKLPITSPESVYVAFPFSGPESSIYYEAQGAFAVPGEEQIPGSSSDWQTLQNFVAVRDPQSQVVMSCEEVPLVQLGALNLGKWQPVTRVEKPHVYSWVMNNYWFTNFRAEQEGEFKWTYSLTSGRDRTSTFATRFGWAARIPMVARVFPALRGAPPVSQNTVSALSLNAGRVLVVETRPARDGKGIVLQLRETEGQPVTITADDLVTAGQLDGADQVNALEQTVDPGINSLTLAPYEVKFVRLRFQ